jgi:hypothetical protein
MNCNYLFFLFLLTFILIPVYSEPKKNKKDKGVSSWFQWSKVQASLKTASNKFVKATEKLEDIIFGESCPYVDRPAEAVRKKLQSGIKAQPMVIDAVTDHIKGWYSTDKPLVLAFTGPTGVGKTETAVLLAEAILKKKVRMSRRGRMIPKGLLVFQGADFADSSISRSEYHIRITSQLANMLRKCGNHAVVIFDEVQKVTSGVLDVLLESMSEHPRLTYYNYKTKETEIFDTSKVIFILISDVGGTRMFELVLEKNGRENIKKSYVQNEIRKIMRKQWDRLQFTQNVDGNVPFLPFEQEHINEILIMKMNKLNNDGIKKKLWKKLIWTNEFISFITDHKNNKYIRYIKLQTSESLKNGYKFRIFSKYGARNIMNDGPLDGIKTQLFKIKDDRDNNMIYQFDVVKDNDEKKNLIVRLDQCKEISEADGNCKIGNSQTCSLLCETKFRGELND